MRKPEGENCQFHFSPSLPSPADTVPLGSLTGSQKAKEPVEAICGDQHPGGRSRWRGLENGSCEQTEDIQDTYIEINRHYHLFLLPLICL